MSRVVWVLISLFAPTILQASLVTNGGFESGDFSGWNASGFANVLCSAGFAQSGLCAVSMDGPSGVVGQSIATEPDELYTLDFWYSLAGQQFAVKWDGITVFTTGVSTGWTHKVLTDLKATTSSTPIEFDATTFSTPTARLDEVNVVANTPEPSTAWMILMAAFLLSVCYRARDLGWRPRAF